MKMGFILCHENLQSRHIGRQDSSKAREIATETCKRTLMINGVESPSLNSSGKRKSPNFGQKKELSWLPEVDSSHIEKMLYERWKPQWQAAKGNEQFRATSEEYIPLVEAVANTFPRVLRIIISIKCKQSPLAT